MKYNQGQIRVIIETFKEVFQTLSKKKQIELLGHANDIYVFLETLKREAKP